ncbi:ornithine cyclodeaminase family protein [Fusibacter ferrireducens]|uniref:Ornithine cyclodeaminase family protein n=1 Tax=Fusibacter ferrireducens TaxID=2785058 RepID=A0ABR9ZN41_9FIRM|nr:ornithine cyclodeaminase family protein [Fusibacter ferrireducens]MBF4691880.1 ornithine cyclodeaminase family protein [Fusibacter ferrireducens]
MVEIKVLSKEAVSKILKMDQVIHVVESVYKAKSEGLTDVWPTVFYDFETNKADLDIKSGYLKNKQIFGHKTVTWFGANVEKNLPTLFGLIAVYSAETGIPIGITDAFYITSMRTGAAGALGALYLARNHSENLLIVGAGNQSIFQIAAMLTVLPHLKKIQVTALDIAESEKFVSSIQKRLQYEFDICSKDVIFKATDQLESAVKESDIIITVTPSRTPIIKKEWIQKGTHISCIGADMKGKQEIDSDIMASAIIFVDDKMHCLEVGEIEIPLKQGIITESNIVGELGDLILNKVIGRTSDDQITIFDATGMALLDIATAELALQLSEVNHVGLKSKL